MSCRQEIETELCAMVENARQNLMAASFIDGEKLNTEELKRALLRLDQFVLQGIIPEDIALRLNEDVVLNGRKEGYSGFHSR
jgi:hypothetical protein